MRWDDADSRGRAMDGLLELLTRYRRGAEAVFDAAAWAVGIYLAMTLRFEFAFGSDSWGAFSGDDLLRAALLAAILQGSLGAVCGLYRGRWRYGSFEEISHLVLAVVLTATVLAVLNGLLFDRLIPTSVAFIGGLVALLFMSAARYIWRLNLERRMRPSPDRAERVVVFGAGEGGLTLITAMLRNPDSPYLPVALLDDHPSKRHLHIQGVPVLGGREDLKAVAERTDATTLVIAVPSADSDLLRQLSETALQADLAVRVLPPMHEFLDGPPGVADIRPITEQDLLGRHEIDTDLHSISEYLTGRRVLVTGAGGSIGSELCYQLTKFAPATLVMLDRDESALHHVKLRIDGRAMLDTSDLVVCDIRDTVALAAAFDMHQPEVVFHAAALKHLPLLETHPREAVKTNIAGSRNVMELAAEHGAERFVNISTDKAADPQSVLGYTKRIAEMLTAHQARTADGVHLSVRFGNVLGSRGSVLTAFHHQIEAGGPVTVTDAEVTRYFMTVEEAVQLVIQAGAIGGPGDALVFDMGSPVRIADVARRLVSQADRPIEIVYTGLRPGEKLHEVLFGADELDHRPSHPLISHVPVPGCSPQDVGSALDAAESDRELVLALRRLCGLTTTPAESAN